MSAEYKTTVGELNWDDKGVHVTSVDDPDPPGDDWELVGSCIGEMRYSSQPILWFWKRVVKPVRKRAKKEIEK